MKKRNKFEYLWGHVTGVCGNNASPVTLAIKEPLEAELAKECPNPNALYKVVKRIAHHDEWEYYGTSMVAKVSGEWTISNADLNFWANMRLFGERDFFPDQFRFVTSGVEGAMHKKRCYQALLRYKENGGLRKEHRALLGALNWEVDMSRGDWVSLFVEGKRPMGDSSRVMRMCQVMGWEMPWLEKDESELEEICERCWDLFDELQFAIQDVFKNEARHCGQDVGGETR